LSIRELRFRRVGGRGAEGAGEEIEERAEGAGEERESDEGPGGEATGAGVAEDPEAGEEREDDEIGEDLGGAPGLEVRREDAPVADVAEGDGGEEAEGGGDEAERQEAAEHEDLLSFPD